MRKLLKQLADLKEEKEILKKAAVYFAKTEQINKNEKRSSVFRRPFFA
jgi:transposase-like protein